MSEPTRGLVIGCGGTLGFAWIAVALQALERELGWDARTAEVLVGTSAGSEMVALLGSGRSADEIVAGLTQSSPDPLINQHLQRHPGIRPPFPGFGFPGRGLTTAARTGEVDLSARAVGLLPRGRGDSTWLGELGDNLANSAGWVDHPATWLVAADAATGRRVAFGSADAPAARLGDAIRASWAIPGWFPPVQIGDRRYVDGGAVRTASADLVAHLELDEVVVIVPMASREPAAAKGLARAERIMRRRMTAGLNPEIDQLERMGTTVIRIEPTQRDLDVMGFNFMDLRRRDRVVETAIQTAPARVREAIGTTDRTTR